jgi:hypothetical protein
VDLSCRIGDARFTLHNLSDEPNLARHALEVRSGQDGGLIGIIKQLLARDRVEDLALSTGPQRTK